MTETTRGLGREMTLFFILDEDEEVSFDIVWPEGFEVPRIGDHIGIGKDGDSVKLAIEQVLWRIFDGAKRDVQVYVTGYRYAWSGMRLSEQGLQRTLEKAGMLRHPGRKLGDR